MKKLRCNRCGTSVWILHYGNICSECHSKRPYRKKCKTTGRPWKKKCKHNFQRNVDLFFSFVCSNEYFEPFNKRDFETYVGVPRTSVNYLIKHLKRIGAIRTIGKIGAQKYISSPKYGEKFLKAIREIHELIQ